MCKFSVIQHLSVRHFTVWLLASHQNQQRSHSMECFQGQLTSVQCLCNPDCHYYNCLYKSNSYNLKFDACADYVWQCSITMRIMEGPMQRQRQERKNIQFRTPSTKLEAILSEKLLKSVHMVSCSYCVQVIIIDTTT